jgi:hypothetical protein
MSRRHAKMWMLMRLFNLFTGRLPVTSEESDTAEKDGLPAAFPCKTVVVVPWFAKSAEVSDSTLYEGAAADPVLLPQVRMRCSIAECIAHGRCS